MLEIRSFGHLNIVVNNIEEAEKYYLELFDAKPIATLPHFKNEGMSKNMGFEGLEISQKILKFAHCNLVITLSEYHTNSGEKEIKKYGVNDIGGPRHIGLHVENIEAAFDFIKSKSEVEVLNKPEFRPLCYSQVTPDQFHLAAKEGEENTKEKERLANLLSKKKSFLFRDRYAVIWEIEERYYLEN